MAKEPLDLGKEIRQLTEDMIARIRQGNDALSGLEQVLMAAVNKAREEGNLDPYFLLNVCRYFRGSVSVEVKSVWDFALNLRQAGKMFLDEPGGNGADIPDAPMELVNMSPMEREKLRKGQV